MGTREKRKGVDVNVISIIVATGALGEIGKDNKLLWDIPEDLAHFKRTTLGKAIVMGRKTYESIGRPLKGRDTIVLTSDPNYPREGIQVVGSIEEVLELNSHGNEIMICGGAEIYEQFLPYTDRIYLTKVYKEYEADTYFPEVDLDNYRRTYSKRMVNDDDTLFEIATYQKKVQASKI